MRIAPYELSFPLAMNDPTGPPRGEGLHASDIYNSYYEQANPKRYGKKPNQPPPDLLFAVGLAWEQYFEKVLIAQGVLCARPGELVGEWKGRDIKFSPDLLICNGEDRLGEIKCAWMSSRLKPTDKDFQKYLTQGKMYAYFTGIHRVRYFVLHMVGNWRDYPFPQMRIWDIEFTKRELMDEMKTMMQHAEDERLFEKAASGELQREKTTAAKKQAHPSRNRH